jgi:hypothetical protein
LDLKFQAFASASSSAALYKNVLEPKSTAWPPSRSFSVQIWTLWPMRFKPRHEAAWANLKHETGKNDGKQPTNESTVTNGLRQNVANTSCSGQMHPK